MTKDYDRAALMVGSFLKWFSLANAEIEGMINSTNLSFWEKRKLKKALKVLKKTYQRSERDFLALIEELAKLDGTDGSAERATDVYRLVHRTFAKAQIQYKETASIFSKIRFTRGK